MALTAIAFAVMFLLMPYFSDDFWYMAPTRGFIEGRDASIDWRAVAESIRFHYLTDNGRLSNAFFTVLIILPKWFLGLLTSVLNAASLFMLARLAGLSPRRPAGAIWLCLLFSAILPWYDCIFFLCFQFNYVWAMALSLFALLVFLSPRRFSPFLLFLLGLITGAWHEGFSAPLLAACVVLSCWHPRRFLSWGRIALMVGLLAGLLYLLSSPAFFRYDEGAVGLRALLEPAQWYRAIRINIFLIAALGLMLIALLRPASRPLALHSAPIACAIMGFVGLLMYEYIPAFERVSFCPRLMAVALLPFLFHVLFHPRPNSVRVRLSAIATLIAAVFLVSHLGFAIVASERFRKGMERAAGPDEFIDFPWSADARFMALGKPFSPEQESYLEIDARFRREANRPALIFAPRELEYVDATTGQPFPSIPGLRVLDGRLYIPADSLMLGEDDATIHARVCYGRSNWRPRSVIPRRFTSRADSCDYYFLSIQDLYPYGRFMTPTAIEWQVKKD